MNFRTTILLFVVLIAAAVVFFVAQSRQSASDQATSTKTDTEDKGRAGQKLVDLSTANVNKVVVTPASGDKLAFERSGIAEWRITSPVNAPADAFKVDDLVREVTELRTSGRTDVKDKGLDTPQYVIEVTDKEGKTTKINVGSRSAVGDILYVKLEGHDQADLVSASIVDQLEKPVSEYRKTKLLTTSNDKITGVTVKHDGQTLKLTKSGEKWQVVEPKQMAGDSGQISTLLSAITGLNAVKFVAEQVGDPTNYGFNKPQMTVSYTTAPPETQPTTKATATTQPAGETTTIKFGRWEDVRKKDLYAIVSDSGPVVTVAGTTLDSFKKTPLDLRDRDVVNVDPNAVSRVSISIDKAATTQPTSQPAVKKELVLERRSDVEQPEPPGPATKPASPAAPAGPRPSSPQSRVNTTPDGEGAVQLAAFAEPAAEPTTKPSTGPTTAPSTSPATTQVAATQPAKPKTKWLITSEPKGDANDSNIQALLESIHPLRAEKYVEKFPTTQAAPAATYILRINTRAWADEPAKNIELKITDPGPSATPVGQLGDLTFEVSRTLLDKITADYTPSKNPPPSAMPQGFPGFPGAPGGRPGMPAGHPQIPLPPDDGGN
jgi:hypothetical protein